MQLRRGFTYIIKVAKAYQMTFSCLHMGWVGLGGWEPHRRVLMAWSRMKMSAAAKRLSTCHPAVTSHLRRFHFGFSVERIQHTWGFAQSLESFYCWKDFNFVFVWFFFSAVWNSEAIILKKKKSHIKACRYDNIISTDLYHGKYTF